MLSNTAELWLLQLSFYPDQVPSRYFSGAPPLSVPLRPGIPLVLSPTEGYGPGRFKLAGTYILKSQVEPFVKLLQNEC